MDVRCTECGGPTEAFHMCKKCDYKWLERMRKEKREADQRVEEPTDRGPGA